MFGDLVNIGGDNHLFQFPQLLSLHRRYNPPSIERKEKPRRLRFTRNPQIGASLILRNCLKIILPLYMIINKRGKGSQLNISQVSGWVRVNVHGTSHLIQIEFVQQVLFIEAAFHKGLQELGRWCPLIRSPLL